MSNSPTQPSADTTTYMELVKSFPCFAALSDDQVQVLTSLMQIAHFEPGTVIVRQDDLIDKIFMIINGQAEVTEHVHRGKKTIIVPLALLSAGESIGLNDIGFYSTTGKRTATVTAVTPMVVLSLTLNDLNHFMQQNQLENTMSAASKQMLIMSFIKQSLPFAKLSHERLIWLSSKVEERQLRAGEILFRQGEQGNTCYLIKSGVIDIYSEDESGKKHALAQIKPPVLFGEATLITDAPRNATACAATDCELLVLRHEYLSELIESEAAVAQMFMTLMVDRSRPLRNPNVTSHLQKAADGQQFTILKNADNSSYFKLSPHGAYIWQQLDGKHTLQDITLNLADHFQVFSPDAVAALISKLTNAGFITNLGMPEEKKLIEHPIWVRSLVKLRSHVDKRFAFGDADHLLSEIYQKFVRYIFMPPGKIILALFAVFGLIAFVYWTPKVLLFFDFKHASLLLLLTLIPLSLLTVLFHELGHAFTVKAFGREVHYLGIGWSWLVPIAFTDTSDMWLSSRTPRMLVNLAGIYVNVIIAGIASLLVFLVQNHYVQAILWLFALYTYISAFRHLSPLQERDGYYVLMDWVEKPQLRQSAVLWLVKKFPKALRQPQLFKENLPEVYYWCACILFLGLVSVLTLLIQGFILAVFDIQLQHPYLALVLPFILVIFSCLSIIAEVRNQAED